QLRKDSRISFWIVNRNMELSCFCKCLQIIHDFLVNTSTEITGPAVLLKVEDAINIVLRNVQVDLGGHVFAGYERNPGENTSTSCNEPRIFPRAFQKESNFSGFIVCGNTIGSPNSGRTVINIFL